MSVHKIAVIGAGLIGRQHCALIAGNRNAELVGIADVSAEAQPYAESMSAPYFEDYRDMLEDTKPDGVVIALPNQLHVSSGLDCIARGIPCLIEKPIAESVDAAAKLVEASERAEVPVLVGHHRRYSPDMLKAREVIRDGTLGPLVTASGLWLMDKPDGYFAADWRRAPGGGPILINLIHDIDCLRYLVGEIDSISAITSNVAREFDVEDTVSLSIRFENGALGSFILSDAVASPYGWDATSGQALYFPHQPGDCYIFGGRKGSLAVPSMTLWRHETDGESWQDPVVAERFPLDGTRAYENQLDHFLAVISGTAEPAITARDAMMTLAATLAVETAAKEGRIVKIESEMERGG